MTARFDRDGLSAEDARLLSLIEEPGPEEPGDHVSLDELVAYATAERSEEVAPEVDEHMRTCSTCAELAHPACELWSEWCRSGDAAADERAVAAWADRLVNAAFGDDPVLAQVAAKIVAAIGPAVLTDAFQDALRRALAPGSGAVEVAVQVIEAFGARAARGGIPEAVHRLLISGDLLEKLGATTAGNALGEGVTDETIAAFAVNAAANMDPLLRGSSAAALAHIGSRAASHTRPLEAMTAMLADPIAALRAAACDALASFGPSVLSAARLRALAPLLIDRDLEAAEAGRRAIAKLVPMAATFAAMQVARWPGLLLQGLMNAVPRSAAIVRPTAFGSAPVELGEARTGVSAICHPGDRFGLRLALPDAAKQLIAQPRPLHVIVLSSDAAGMHCMAPLDGFSTRVEQEADGHLRLPLHGSHFVVGSSVGHQAAIVVLAVGGNGNPFEGIHVGVAGAQLEARLTDLEEALAAAAGLDWWQSVVFPFEVVER